MTFVFNEVMKSIILIKDEIFIIDLNCSVSHWETEWISSLLSSFDIWKRHSMISEKMSIYIKRNIFFHDTYINKYNIRLSRRTIDCNGRKVIMSILRKRSDIKVCAFQRWVSIDQESFEMYAWTAKRIIEIFTSQEKYTIRKNKRKHKYNQIW